MTLLDSATAPAPGPDGRRTPSPVVVLGVALVVALVALGVAAWAWDKERDESDDVGRATELVQERADDAEAAARDAAVSMTTYDYRTIAEDFAWIDQVGTEEFRKDFTKASRPVRRVVGQTRTHAEGKVVESLAVLDDPTHATVVLFVDQVITDVTSPPKKLDRTRIKVLMVLQDGRWLVEEIQAY